VVAIGFLGAGFAGGYYVGNEQLASVSVMGVSNKTNARAENVDFDIFWKTWKVLDDKFIPGVNATSTNVDVAKNDQEKVYGAISGLVNSMGDPYTVFMPPAEKKQFEQAISGNFGGVGMEVGIKDGIITVIAPLEGTPAKRAGILTGDKIVAINGSSTEGLAVDQAVQKSGAKWALRLKSKSSGRAKMRRAKSN
jgi:C-terminal processing protease CtpA/Prc